MLDDLSAVDPSLIMINLDVRFKSVLMATRPMYPNPLKTLACFEVNSSTEWNFNQVFEPLC